MITNSAPCTIVNIFIARQNKVVSSSAHADANIMPPPMPVEPPPNTLPATVVASPVLLPSPPPLLPSPYLLLRAMMYNVQCMSGFF